MKSVSAQKTNGVSVWSWFRPAAPSKPRVSHSAGRVRAAKTPMTKSELQHLFARELGYVRRAPAH